MTYDHDLADRVRAIIGNEPGLSETKMFGGLAFSLHGHLTVSASGQGGLMLRVEPAETETLVALPHADRVEMRGRAMNGWLRVAPEGLDTEEALRDWVRRSVTYARSLPPK